MDEYSGVGELLYDALSTGLEGDAAIYVEEARRAGPQVLASGCGTGRITIQVAEAGLTIVGLECSPEMLAIAAHKTAVMAPHDPASA